MSYDPIRAAFLETVIQDAELVNADSDVVRLAARPQSGTPPDAYDGMFLAVEHLRRTAEGTVAVSSDPVPFILQIPEDYLRSTDIRLQFRVARVLVPLMHPNVSGDIVCLGPQFRPGTRLVHLVEQLFGIVAGRVFATDHAAAADARAYYLDHLEEVRALKAPPLWRRSVAPQRHVWGEAVAGSAATAGGAAHLGGR